MKDRISASSLSQLREQLADIEHERWSHWQRYMHGRGRRGPDGSLIIPAELADKWEKQSATAYAALGEDAKQSDREQVDRYLPTVLHALGISIKDKS